MKREDDINHKYRITNGQILFSWSGSPILQLISFYGPEERDGSINTLSELFLLLKNFKNSFIEIARNKQTTGLGHVTSRDLKNMYVAFPAKEVIKRFNETGRSIIDKIFCNSLNLITYLKLGILFFQSSCQEKFVFRIK